MFFFAILILLLTMNLSVSSGLGIVSYHSRVLAKFMFLILVMQMDTAPCSLTHNFICEIMSIIIILPHRINHTIQHIYKLDIKYNDSTLKL